MTEPTSIKTKVRRVARPKIVSPIDDDRPEDEAPDRSADTLTLRIKSRTLNDGAQDAGRMIAEAAYYRAEKRGFAPGYDVEDWIAAEQEVRTQLEQA
jgi:Protein of unknown function (DUF2934)